MFGIFDKIEEFFNDLLIGIIEQNLTSLLVDVNDRVGTIAAEVGQTPQAWNGSIFTLIKSLSDTVIVPIAGLVMTGILCYELLSMLMEKNNLHEMDTWMFFRWMMKAFIAIYLVTNTFNIVMAVFDVGQHIVSSSAGVINMSTSIDISSTITSMVDGLELLSTAELAIIALETLLVKISILAISVIITVILYGRMIEIYLSCSIAAIPLATMANKEWGQIGSNYLRGLVALGIQGFFIMVCVGIYAVLVGSIAVTDNIHTTIFSILTYTVILCFALIKTSGLAKSVMNAH
ncbi:conserved hypothetical protein [Alkaliphilus metalliredigens QYMF]|uniref:TrbL/VirB6 plasmid conjugal transfer protein n=1 Tax=Alkaliphilus metalliredigens (strain QYMF) TaxID=293826 RepID=A6TV50_ALKMQ|nr:CD0415/CD1112 family protein [Alkaliphilus metalliredigens]ABR50068.1 conserved hypothetical protein [Alkaliphilus metalliredigens QYMF]